MKIQNVFQFVIETSKGVIAGLGLGIMVWAIPSVSEAILAYAPLIIALFGGVVAAYLVLHSRSDQEHQENGTYGT